MIALILLTLSPALADDTTLLEGERCTSKGICTDLKITLYDSGRFITSDGLAGTYSVPADRHGQPQIAYTTGRTGGTMDWGPDNCWEEATSPLNPDIGSVNVCLTAEAQTVRPYSASCEVLPQYHTGPLASENGHWAAGRITPEQPGGFWVHTVSYFVEANYGPIYQCAPLDHRVQLFIGDADEGPPDTPTVVYAVLTDDLVPDSREVTFELPTPLFIDGDESLWVSMEQIYDADSTSRTCVGICDLDGRIGDRSFWSNSATTPYSWVDLNSWGIPEMMVKATGMHAAP